MAGCFPDYAAVANEIERIVTERREEPISTETLANVNDLIATCRNGVRVPDEVGTGYWPTIWLQWGYVQIEVFDTRLEVYHLREGETSIWYEEHRPGSSFSDRFMAEISKLSVV